MTNQKKPKLFYAHPEEFYYTLCEAQPGMTHEDIIKAGNDCYVEHSAYEQAQAEIKRLREALKDIKNCFHDQDDEHRMRNIAKQALIGEK